MEPFVGKVYQGIVVRCKSGKVWIWVLDTLRCELIAQLGLGKAKQFGSWGNLLTFALGDPGRYSLFDFPKGYHLYLIPDEDEDHDETYICGMFFS